MFGTTAATAPSASWSISRSRSHDIQNDSTSKRVLAVGAKAWASPVQPRRSSRCGQSVGNDTKLSRCDQATLEWSRSRRGSEEAKLERGVSALEMATAVADTTSAPVTSAYWKPWNVKSGSSVRLAVVGEHVRIGRHRGAEGPGVDRPIGLEHLRVADLHAVARRSADDESEPAGDVLADVDERVPVARLDRRRPLADRADAARDAGFDDRRVDVDLPCRRPTGVVEAGGVPADGLGAEIDLHAVVEARRADAAGRRRPLGRRRHAHVRAVGALDVELRERRHLRAELLGAVLPAEAAAVPAVAEQRAERVLAGAQQLGDIPRAEHDPILVRGPSGREVLVGRLPAVDAELADAPERGAEPRSHGCGGEREARAEQHRRALDRLRSADRAGLEIGRIDGCLDDELLAPRRPAGRRGDANGVATLLTGFERRTGRCDADRVVGGDGVGDAGVGAVPAHLVAELRGCRRGAPGEAQAGARHAEQPVGVLGAQRDDPGVVVGDRLGGELHGHPCPFVVVPESPAGVGGPVRAGPGSERADTGQGVGSAGAGCVDPRTLSVGSTEKWVGSVRPWMRSRSRRMARSPMASPAWSTVVREMAG